MSAPFVWRKAPVKCASRYPRAWPRLPSGRPAEPRKLRLNMTFRRNKLTGLRHFAACTERSLCHNFVVVSHRSGSMSIDSHLSELVRRHQAIEEAIMAEENHPASDDIRIHELKRKKLHLKDEIERLKHQAETTATH
jgi:hypothetical protein